MEDKTKEMNQKINDIIVTKKYEHNFVYIHSCVFFQLAERLEQTLREFYQNNEITINIEDCSKMSIVEKLEIIKSFLQQHNIDIDLEKVISDGTIELIESNTNDKPFYLNGKSYFQNNHRLVDSCKNGLVGDIPILVHELGHLRNQLKNGDRNYVSDIFTEALARLDELLVLDYLEELGYVEEVNIFRIYLFKNAYKNALYSFPVFKILYLFDELGDISKESYKMLFQDDSDYDNIIKEAQNFIYGSQHNINKFANYLFDTYISSYLYLEYKKDKSYMTKINKLHEFINTKDIYECLKFIGLSDLRKEEKDMLLESVNEIISSITKYREKKLQ